MTHPFCVAACLFSAAMLAASPASAVTTQLFNSLSTFQAATLATSATGALPSPGGAGSYSASTSSLTLGSVTIAAPDWVFTEWSTLLPGAEIAVSNGAGNTDVPNRYYNDGLDAVFAAPVYAAGFDFHQPTAAGTLIDGCNTPVCVDSQFRVEAWAGATRVASFDWTPRRDQRDFWGVWSDTAFNRLEIRETLGTDDNEFYGEFYSGMTPVPEPGTAALWWLGLATVAAAATRRRR